MATLTRPQVGYRDLRSYLELLETAGLLKHITAEVDLKHEVGAICARSGEEQGPALMFDTIKGYAGKRLVSNIISTLDQLAIALNTDPDPDTIYNRIVDGMANRIPSVTVETGPCKEEKYLGDDVNLYEFPTPWWHELDGGQYIATAAGIITRDPDTGVLNMGTYRCMILDKNHLTLSGQVMARDVRRYDARNEPTQVAVVIGMDPLLTLASGTPVPVDANRHMEYEAAGAWRGSATELVKCETSDLLVPAQAEIVIEGEIPPGARTVEGPHGEAAGFYGQNLAAGLINVKCITHRHNPINYGIICLLEEDYPRWILRSGSCLYSLKYEKEMSNVTSVYFPEIGGRSWGLAVVAADIQDPDEPKRIIRAAWEIVPHRWVIVVDPDCDVRSWPEVIWRACTSADPERDILRGPDVPVPEVRRSEMDIDSEVPSPIGIDATFKYKFSNIPPINKVSRELTSKVAGRWAELGLGR